MKKLILISTLLSGCAHHYQSTDTYNAKTQTLDREYGKQLVLWKESCAKLKEEENAGPFKYTQCIDSLGLESEIHSKKLIKDVLDGRAGADAALQKEIKKNTAKLVLTYPMADMERVALECDAKGGCTSFIEYEAMAQRSHNNRVISAYRNDLAAANHDYADSLKEEQDTNSWRRSLGAMLRGMGSGLTQGSQAPTHCMTTGGSGLYNTTCN